MTQQSTSFQGNKLRLYLGSGLLFICIFSSATVIGILILLTWPLPFSVPYKLSALWCAFVLWMTKVFCGLSYQVEGLEHLDTRQTAIVLCKHQSAWETLALRCILPTQSVLLKRSLTWLPVWGWALATLKSIAIDRNSQREALRILLDKGTRYLNQGLWIIIFPEGTRTAVGEVRKFGAGGAMLAHKSGHPVIPIAHNAGTFWPRYSFLKYPGTITVKIGPVIESDGRKAADINSEAEAWINTAMEEMNQH